MSSKIKVIYLAVFSFFICCLAVGYAALTDSISALIGAEGEAQTDVFIADVTNNTSNFSLKGYYSTYLQQEITLAAEETSEYIVKLYNNNGENKFIFDGYVCELIPNGINIEIEELNESNEFVTTNVISSLIDTKGFDFFKITYTNTTNSKLVVDTPIKFNYTKLTNQVKVDLIYNDTTYTKYAALKNADIKNVYNDVIFDQVEVDVNNNTNRVIRCNNGAILSTEITAKNKLHVKLSNITNYSNVMAGELDVTCRVYDTLTNATMSVYPYENTPNNFIVLQDITDGVESTSTSILVGGKKDYSINLNSKEVIVSKTIQNEGKLRIYDSTANKGKLLKKYSASQRKSTRYLEEYGVYAITQSDLLQNLFKDSVLKIENVCLELLDTDVYTPVYSGLESKTEYPAIIVGFEGLVEIKDSDLHTNYGYGIHKKSYYAGEYNDRFLNPTSDESKIVLETSTLISDYNNCIRFSDGRGIISLVDSYVASSTSVPYEEVGEYKRDPIFAARHIFEGMNSGSKYIDIYNLYTRFYRYATTEAKIYITGGTLVCNATKDVNHFYSSNELNMRVFYTKTAKFMKKIIDGSGNETYVECGIAVNSNNKANFKYPLSMVNGNSALDSDLYNGDGSINRNHYLNNDGWYYIKRAVTDGPIDNTSSAELLYNTDEFIENAEYEYLYHMDKKIRVGDSFELINFNAPGSYYVDVSEYDNSTNFFAPLESIDKSSGKTQADYVGFDYEFTFLASGDEKYFNIVSLGNLYGVLHIEHPESLDPNTHNVGIKYIDTSKTSVALDKEEQRFTLMQYNYTDAQDVPTYVFISKFNSVLSYIETEADDYFDTGTNAALTDPSFRDNGYGFDYEHHLISNRTSMNYRRNGWYLWQDEITIKVDVSFEGLTSGSEKDFGDHSIKVSGDTIVTQEGVLLQSNHSNQDPNSSNYNGDDDFGYIRINSDRALYGVQFTIKNVGTTTDYPWLIIRTHNRNGEYVLYDIEYSNAVFGIYRPIKNGEIQYDYDENKNKGTPYYVITEGVSAGTQTITIYFDAKYTNWDVHSVTIDPFDDENKINTMLISSITLIEPVNSSGE